MSTPSSTQLARLIDATVEWHRIFALDANRVLANQQVYQQLDFFITEARYVRWALTSNKDKVGEIWNRVIPGSIELPEDEEDLEEVDKALAISEDVIDFVLNGTSYIFAVTAIPSGILDTIIDEVVHAITWPYRSKLIDNNLKDRCAEPAFLKQAFTENAWMLFMYILSISPIAPLSLPANLSNTSSNGAAQ